MLPPPRNLLSPLPTTLPEERVDVLTPPGAVRVERIVSTGHASPPGFWYDQPEAEWVMVLQGAGRIAYEDGAEESLRAGDHTWIAPHRRHRVAWTSPDEPTVWLAVFYAP
jgi:cupin 2 domain-containing protein